VSPPPTRTFLIAWHPGQRRWAGGLRYTALLQEAVRGLSFGQVEERKDPPTGGAFRKAAFWVFYLSATLLHLATVVFAGLGLLPVWRPLARGLKSLLAWLWLPRVVEAPSTTVLFEIGKSVYGPAWKKVLWVPDLQHRQLPENFSAAQWINREINWRGSYCLADAAVASSKAVERDIDHYWGRRALLHCWKFPASAPFRSDRPAPAIPAPYVLYAAQFWPHKGHADLCQAFRALIAARPGSATLVLAGRAESALPGLRDWIRAEKLEDRILLTIDASDDVLGGYLQHATGLVFPSHFEGWSTSVLEAIALGVPLVLSDLPSHVEVGLPAEAHFKTGDATSLRSALEKLLWDPAFRKRIVDSYSSLSLPTAASFARDVAATLASLEDRSPG